MFLVVSVCLSILWRRVFLSSVAVQHAGRNCWKGDPSSGRTCQEGGFLHTNLDPFTTPPNIHSLVSGMTPFPDRMNKNYVHIFSIFYENPTFVAP